MQIKIKLTFVAAALAILSGCTGSVHNKPNNCSYDYLIHPAISVPGAIGACNENPTNK